jgi:hypothetical protein
MFPHLFPLISLLRRFSQLVLGWNCFVPKTASLVWAESVLTFFDGSKLREIRVDSLLGGRVFQSV